jgi:hypothetical protein
MENGQNHGSKFKKEMYAMSQFNDSEYQRWSKGITKAQSPSPQSGIESFLGTDESLQTASDDTSVTEIGEQ